MIMNCSVTRLLHDRQRFSLASFNECSYLWADEGGCCGLATIDISVTHLKLHGREAYRKKLIRLESNCRASCLNPMERLMGASDMMA